MSKTPTEVTGDAVKKMVHEVHKEHLQNTGAYMAGGGDKPGDAPKKPKLGSGERFAAIEEHAKKSGYTKEQAGAIAASIGRKKYGKEKFQKMAAKGRKRASK